MAHGKHFRQFWSRGGLHDRSRYRIEYAGGSITFDKPLGMGNECIWITEQTHQSLQHNQIGTSDVTLPGNPAEGHLEDVHHGTHMRIDERQAGQLLLECPQGGQRLVGHFRFARVDAIPCLVRRPGNLSEKCFGEIFHFLIKAGLGHGFRDGMIHERRNPVQLPRKAHA